MPSVQSVQTILQPHCDGIILISYHYPFHRGLPLDFALLRLPCPDFASPILPAVCKQLIRQINQGAVPMLRTHLISNEGAAAVCQREPHALSLKRHHLDPQRQRNVHVPVTVVLGLARHLPIVQEYGTD